MLRRLPTFLLIFFLLFPQGLPSFAHSPSFRFVGTAGLDPTDLPKVVHNKVSFQQVVAELPLTCPNCVDYLAGKNDFTDEEAAKIEAIITATARDHGLTLAQIKIYADADGKGGTYDKDGGGTIFLNASDAFDPTRASSGETRVSTLGHEPGHPGNPGEGEDYPNLLGAFAVDAFNLAAALNGREPLSATGETFDWTASYIGSDYIKGNNALAGAAAQKPDTENFMMPPSLREIHAYQYANGDITPEEYLGNAQEYEKLYAEQDKKEFLASLGLVSIYTGAVTLEVAGTLVAADGLLGLGGWLLGARGSDYIATGIMQTATGEAQPTVHEKALVALGVEPGFASWVMVGYDLGLPAAIGSKLPAGWGYADDLAAGGATTAKTGAGAVDDMLPAAYEPAGLPAVAGSSANPDFYVYPTGDIIPSNAYRYVSSDAEYLQNMLNTGKIPAQPHKGTYFTFDKIDTGIAAKIQVPHDAALRIEFRTNQLLDDIRIPHGEWGTANYLEPIAKSYPEFGTGGATQSITKLPISVDRIIDTRTGKILYERK